MPDPAGRFDAIVTKLKKRGHKLTPQRLAIIRFLAKSDGHPSVDDLFRHLQNDFPTMSLATVYRNVMLIKSLGEVLELGFADGSNRYDGNKPYPHPHIICVKCKKIIDPELPGFQDMAEQVGRITGFEILSHRVDFFGVCPNCRTKE